VNVGSLFSGIGGLDLGLERAGMTVIWQSEIDPYASRVLAKHWPNVPNLGDITTIDWSTVERPDVICGGYPCQPFSLAGVRRGEDDPRHLWPHFHRAIRHLRPRYALLENVPGHLSMGFDAVLGDLAEIGYDTEWCSIPAAAVGAPHLRWRIFAVAYPHVDSEPGVAVDAFARSRVMVPDAERDELRQQPISIFGRSDTAVARDDGEAWDVADARGCEHPRQRSRIERPQGSDGERDVHQWRVEPDVGRVASRLSPKLDGGGLDAQRLGDTQARSAGAPDDDRVRAVRRNEPTATTPPGLLPTGVGHHPMPVLPCEGGHGGRVAAGAPGEDVRDLWHVLFPLQPQPGEVLFEGMSERARAAQRAEALGNPWLHEPSIARVAAGVANRVDRLRCLGNAVVPQVAQWIGERIMEAAA
jgi:site-specific DNA-cytosine methylase